MSTNTPRTDRACRDWPEDFAMENGNYLNRCFTCERVFAGHKHRHQCKQCSVESEARWNALTPEQRAKETEECAREIAKFLDQIV